MPDSIIITRQGRVMKIRIHRPQKKNALTLEMYRTMARALREADADDAVRVIVFTGSERCFTSGNDLQDFIQSPFTDETGPAPDFMLALTRVRKPVIAAVAGLAIGIGTTMLLHCDLVYAGESARFQMPFVNLGVCPEAGSSYLLPRMMGHARAAELLLLGEPFNARKALAYGLVNAVVPDAELEQTALSAAGKLAAQPPNAVQVTKALLKKHSEGRLKSALHEEIRTFASLLQGPEAREAIRAFTEKRPPDFSKF